MATASDGLLGEVSGKVGNIVFTKWKGVRVIALAFDPENNLGYYRIGEGAVREDESFLLPVLTGEKQYPLETYLAFASAVEEDEEGEEDASDSVYLGKL
jgi:hypothetical protein